MMEKLTEINRKIKRVILMDLDFSFIIKSKRTPFSNHENQNENFIRIEGKREN